jgi:hypothetical protein
VRGGAHRQELREPFDDAEAGTATSTRSSYSTTSSPPSTPIVLPVIHAVSAWREHDDGSGDVVGRRQAPGAVAALAAPCFERLVAGIFCAARVAVDAGADGRWR